MKNKVLLTIASLVLIGGFLAAVYLSTNKPQQNSYAEVNKIESNDRVKWAKTNRHILVEYSDFQCPACRNFHELLKTFEASSSPDFKITQKVTFVYRHFPLIQIHPNAQLAAYAAEAAGEQGKFFQMHDLLFENQDAWAKLPNPQDKFIEFAGNLDLSIDKFRKDLVSNKIIEKVNKNRQSGNSASVDSTPTFFLNGRKIQVRSFEEFKDVLNNLP